MKRILAVGTMTLLAFGLMSSAVYAQETGPDTAACATALSDPELLLLSSDVYPNNIVPSTMTLGIALAVVADVDLGGDGRVLFESAVAACTTPPSPPADEFDCDDFATQDDAQAKLNEDLSDPHNLDSDDDNIACESRFPPTTVTETPPPPVTINENNVDVNVPGQVARVPSGAVATGDGSSL